MVSWKKEGKSSITMEKEKVNLARTSIAHLPLTGYTNNTGKLAYLYREN